MHRHVESLSDAAEALGQPVGVALEDVEEAFVEFWERLLAAAVVLLIIGVAAWCVPKVLAACMRQAQFHAWTVNSVRYLVRIGIVTLALYSAFLASGVTLNIVVLGLVISAANPGFAGLIGNAACGVLLQFDDTLQPGRFVTLPSLGHSGFVIDSNLHRVRIALRTPAPDPTAPTPPPDEHVARNLFVPNTTFCSICYTSDAAVKVRKRPAPVLDESTLRTVYGMSLSELR